MRDGKAYREEVARRCQCEQPLKDIITIWCTGDPSQLRNDQDSNQGVPRQPTLRGLREDPRTHALPTNSRQAPR